MDNIYGKKLPGTTLPSASGSDYLLAETSDGKLNWIDSGGAKELADKPWANSTFLTPSTAASTYVPMQFTIGEETHYIGKEVSLDISSGTHVLTNCSGTITVSGNSAKVYIYGSPNLTVTGVTNNNFYNVFRDGMAERNYINSVSGGVILTDTSKDIVTLCTNYDGVNLPYDELYIIVYIMGWGNTPLYFNPYINAGYHMVLSKGGFVEFSVVQRGSTLVLTGSLYNATDTATAVTKVTLRKHV